jgi:hypothetical protein
MEEEHLVEYCINCHDIINKETKICICDIKSDSSLFEQQINNSIMILEDPKSIYCQMKGECPLQPTKETICLTNNIRLSPLKNRKPSGYFKRKIDEYGYDLIIEPKQSPQKNRKYSNWPEVGNDYLLEKLSLYDSSSNNSPQSSSSLSILSDMSISESNHSSPSILEEEIIPSPLLKKVKRSLLDEFESTIDLMYNNYDDLFN